MSDEQTQAAGTSSDAGSGSEQGSQTQGPETLDAVYKEFGIEDQAQQFQQARQQQQSQPAQQHPVTVQQPQQETPSVAPDPTLDPQGYQRYEAARLRDQQALRQTLSNVVGQLSKFQQDAARQVEEADIRKAVGVLKEKIPGVDDDMLEIALGHKARKDPKFMSVWQQRQAKPEAWNRALQAVAVEFSGKFGARQDPQLTENTRAMKAAVGAASTTRAPADDKKFSDDPREFQRQWDSYVSSSY